MSPYVGVLPFLISLILYITVGPFALLFGLINELIRFIVSIYLQIKYDGEVFLMSSGNDAMFSGKIPNKPRMVILGFRFKGKTGKQDVMGAWADKIIKEKDAEGNTVYKRFEYLITQKFGYGCWQIDRNFDLNNHVRMLNEKLYRKSDLQELLRELSEDNMHLSLPQWECVIVSRYKEDGEKGETGWLLVRFNHSYTDGLSSIMFMEKYFCSNFTYYVNPMKFEIASWKRFLFYLNSLIFAPYTLAVLTINSYRKTMWPVLLEISKGEKLQRNYHWIAADLKMETVKKVRKGLNNTTISAVVENAFISATLQTLPSKRIPEEWMVAEIAAILPYKGFGPQNRFTAFMYTINSLEDDFERLKMSKKAAWNGMTGPFIPLVYFLFMTVGRQPAYFRSLLFSHMPITFFFSCVPTSKTTSVAVGNSEIKEFIGFPPQPTKAGITLGCNTYANGIKISCAAESDWLRKEELDEIMEKVPKIIEDWAIKVEELNEET